MSTTGHLEVSFETLTTEENPRFVAFVDACFDRAPDRSLRHAFPTALAAANREGQFVGTVDAVDGPEWACAATALLRTWLTEAGPVAVACLGCFSTPERFRRRGLSRRLQEHMIARLTDCGVQWAVLWTDRPEFYRSRGFEFAGTEYHVPLDGASWPTLPAGARVRTAGPEDANALLQLYRGHALRADRSVEDMRAHLQPTTTRAVILELDHRIEAYVLVGKGEDFPGYVAEFAGSARGVQSLIGHVHNEDAAAALLLPRGAEALVDGIPGLRVSRRPIAMVRRLQPGAPDPARHAWAVWGMDSA